MLSVSDFIRLPYRDELTAAGLTYALRSLPYTYDRMGGDPYARLRRITAGTAAELAFRRLLDQRQVPYDTFGATPFSEPDRYDAALGGRRCDLKCFVLSEREQIREARRSPEILLDAPALIPADQAESTTLGEGGLYLFAFVLALYALKPDEIASARAAGQPIAAVHLLPENWLHPSAPPGRLALKLQSAAPGLRKVEVGGLTASPGFHVEQMELSPGQRAETLAAYTSVAYLRLDDLPGGKLGVGSAITGMHVAGPDGWGNAWVYGMEILLTGWMAAAEFYRRAERIPTGSRVLQYRRTRTPNLAVPIRALHPLEDLFAAATDWQTGRQ
jgi:hypothetical protein